ncbi:MAG: hypothetical protein ACLUGJ_14120 [Blautia wexlerae]
MRACRGILPMIISRTEERNKEDHRTGG